MVGWLFHKMFLKIPSSSWRVSAGLVQKHLQCQPSLSSVWDELWWPRRLGPSLSSSSCRTEIDRDHLGLVRYRINLSNLVWNWNLLEQAALQGRQLIYNLKGLSQKYV